MATTLTIAAPAIGWAQSPAVVSFSLVDADTDQEIGPLADGATLNLASLPTRRLNVRADTSPSVVGSVQFTYDLAPGRIENSPPYALAGNSGTDYYPWTPTVGLHTITATAYTLRGATGVSGGTRAVRFNVVDEVVGQQQPPAAADPGIAQLVFSLSSSRSNPGLLTGVTVSGTIYVFAPAAPDVVAAQFWLDDPDMLGPARQSERSAPWDFAGGSDSAANPFDTRTVGDGGHTISVALRLTDGGHAVGHATFYVANAQTESSSIVGQQQPPAAADPGIAQLVFSLSSSRSNPGLLTGVTVSGTIYVFAPAAPDVAAAQFWLDDPDMLGPARQSERSAPWDFAGGSGSAANPFDTRTVGDGSHTISVALRLTDGGHAVGHATFHVANTQTVSSSTAPGPSGVAIVGEQFYLEGVVTYPGARAQGRLLNLRAVNSVFEDAARGDFDPEANTEEFIGVMPDYVAHGVRAFTVSLQGGNPGYEGAVNTAFRADGSLKSAYLARVQRVIEAADSLGATVILNLFYQRQDEHLADETAVRAGVVNVANWVAQQGFRNVLLEIANEYPHGGFDHGVIQSATGMASLIRLAKSTAPELYVSASGVGYGTIDAEVAEAADYLLLHFNDTAVEDYASRIAALKSYGKPIVVNEDTKVDAEGVQAAEVTVTNGASWGLLSRPNQDYPFSFGGATDDPIIYAKLLQLATP